MAYLPSFNKGSTPTMLDSEVAKKVKVFIEGLMNAEVYEVEEVPRFEFSEDRVVLYVRRIPEGYIEKEVTLCEDGVNTTYVMLLRSKDP